jgi:hypothetical protein
VIRNAIRTPRKPGIGYLDEIPKDREKKPGKADEQRFANAGEYSVVIPAFFE